PPDARSSKIAASGVLKASRVSGRCRTTRDVTSVARRSDEAKLAHVLSTSSRLSTPEHFARSDTGSRARPVKPTVRPSIAAPGGGIRPFYEGVGTAQRTHAHPPPPPRSYAGTRG